MHDMEKKVWYHKMYVFALKVTSGNATLHGWLPVYVYVDERVREKARDRDRETAKKYLQLHLTTSEFVIRMDCNFIMLASQPFDDC